MLDLLKTYWPTIMSVSSFIVSAFIGLLAIKFAKREDVDAMKSDISKLKSEVTGIKNRIADLPTKEDIHKLNLEISGLRGDIKEIKPELAGVKRISNLLLEHELKEKTK